MKISDLIELLEHYKQSEGDIQVRVLSMTHSWSPDLRIILGSDKKKYLILND